jgi:hypothetical protein
MRCSIILAISFAVTVPAAVIVGRQAIDPDFPDIQDPTSIPTTFQPRPQPENIFRDGFQTTPENCTNMLKPSDQCIRALLAQPAGVVAFSGGELKWDNDNQCDDRKKGAYMTAAYDAYSLAHITDDLPQSVNHTALWQLYIDPDYVTQQQRIIGECFSLRFVRARRWLKGSRQFQTRNRL